MHHELNAEVAIGTPHLINPGQRVHDDGGGGQDLHEVSIDDVLPARRLIVLQPIQEALLLNTSLVKHINLGRNLVQIICFLPLHPFPVNARITCIHEMVLIFISGKPLCSPLQGQDTKICVIVSVLVLSCCDKHCRLLS